MCCTRWQHIKTKYFVITAGSHADYIWRKYREKYNADPSFISGVMMIETRETLWNL